MPVTRPVARPATPRARVGTRATGLGVVDGQGLLAALTARFTKEVTIITDRSTFGKDEIDAMLQISNPAVIDAAFYVTVDGFTPAELGITTTNPTPTQLQAWAPAFTESPTPTGFSIRPSALDRRVAVAAGAAAAVHVRVPGRCSPTRTRSRRRTFRSRLTATTHSTSGTAVIDLDHAAESVHGGRAGLVVEHGRSGVPATARDNRSPDCRAS